VFGDIPTVGVIKGSLSEGVGEAACDIGITDGVALDAEDEDMIDIKVVSPESKVEIESVVDTAGGKVLNCSPTVIFSDIFEMKVSGVSVSTSISCTFVDDLSVVLVGGISVAKVCVVNGPKVLVRYSTLSGEDIFKAVKACKEGVKKSNGEEEEDIAVLRSDGEPETKSN
jgi:hypothetical protein